VWFLVLIQLYSGFFWAGFNLAAANFVFDAVTPAKRARCIAYQAIINGVLVFSGSLAGGFLATYIPPNVVSHIGMWVPPSPYLALFLLSGVLRLAVMMALFPAFKEVRVVGRIRSREMLVRVTTLRPLWGATFALITNRSNGRRDQ
jgi:MFS family permease